jgi:hypothetical protein
MKMIKVERIIDYYSGCCGKKIKPYSHFIIMVNDSKYQGTIDCVLQPEASIDKCFLKDDSITITVEPESFYLKREKMFLSDRPTIPPLRFMANGFFELSKRKPPKDSETSPRTRAWIEILTLVVSIFGKEESVKEYLHYKFTKYGL